MTHDANGTNGTPAPEANGTAPAPRLITVADAAARLGVTPKWIRRHGARERFLYKLGERILRVDEMRLNRYLERVRVEGRVES